MPEFTESNQPKGRGRSFKNKLIDTIRDEALLSLKRVDASDDEVERAFLSHLAKRAFNSDDASSSALLKELISKSYPSLKSALPEYEITLGEGLTPAQKANAIFDAVTSGGIPADVGQLLIQSAKACMEIEIGSDLIDRLEQLETTLTKRLEDLEVNG